MYIARSKEIAARQIGEEMMVMSAVDSTFYTLNEVATVIWNAADGATPLEKIVAEKVCDNFEISQEEANRDASEFVDKLSARGVLLTSDKPITASGTTSS